MPAKVCRCKIIQCQEFALICSRGGKIAETSMLTYRKLLSPDSACKVLLYYSICICLNTFTVKFYISSFLLTKGRKSNDLPKGMKLESSAARICSNSSHTFPGFLLPSELNARVYSLIFQPQVHTTVP